MIDRWCKLFNISVLEKILGKPTLNCSMEDATVLRRKLYFDSEKIWRSFWPASTEDVVFVARLCSGLCSKWQRDHIAILFLTSKEVTKLLWSCTSFMNVSGMWLRWIAETSASATAMAHNYGSSGPPSPGDALISQSEIKFKICWGNHMAPRSVKRRNSVNLYIK